MVILMKDKSFLKTNITLKEFTIKEAPKLDLETVRGLLATKSRSGKTAEIKQLLVKQAASPVLWQHTVENMIADGVKNFVEVGPGKVLTGFVKKINRDFVGQNVEDEASLEKTIAYLQEVR